MSLPTPENFATLGSAYERAFTTAHPVAMPREKGQQYTDWLNENPNYKPEFGQRMTAAVAWVLGNPTTFNEMAVDMDMAIDYLNGSEALVDTAMFLNLEDFRNQRSSVPLPRIDSAMQIHGKVSVIKGIIGAAHRLRWGETIRPEDGDYYSYHKFIPSDQGMVVASMLDLYEIYTKTLGIYPAASKRDAVVAGALTEAVYLTNPSGSLFTALKNPDDGWIKGYDGFSDAFQEHLYGSEQTTNDN